MKTQTTHTNTQRRCRYK